MPLRAFNREQGWLLPPSLDELVPADHPVRFVDMVLEGLGDAEWESLGIDLEGGQMGAPAYHPRALLGVWVYGFMDGVRSSRKLERACRDQLPYAWLSCMQHPDHNTLWRFYRSHRDRMRSLLRLSVRMAVELDLLDLAFQAVDGTKVQASVSRERMLDEEGLERLLGRVDEAISEMEEQEGAENEPAPPRLPGTLAGRKALRERTLEALARVRVEGGPKRASHADPDARLLRGRSGYVAGYNAQAVVSPQAGGGGMLITAADVPEDGDDHAQLMPMISQAEAATGVRAGATLADANYHSGPNLAMAAARRAAVLMPEANEPRQRSPYHKNRFTYREQDDVYVCPEGEELAFRGMHSRPEKSYRKVRRYQAMAQACRACPAFGECTAGPSGRIIYITPHEALLRDHRRLMAQPRLQALYRRRKQTIEPVFGILKEQMGARRFLLRGLENIQAEWTLLAAAFNLRTLARRWAAAQRPPPAPASQTP